MLLKRVLALSLVAFGLASPVTVLKSDPPADAVFIRCEEGTEDPICLLIKQPMQDIITERTHPNGTVEVKRNLYTRSQLQAIREQNSVVSREHKPIPEAAGTSAVLDNFHIERAVGPPVSNYCTSETQKWYDQHDWGYWFQSWQQVGACFYCDQCTRAIAYSFGVSQTWTYGLSAKFADVITLSFGFSWGQTLTLTDTQTCQWNFVESGCHSIWYQPLMSYHNGYANYQTHIHCTGGPNPGDQYVDHEYAFANVNQAGNGGLSGGNLGCNSGCGGSDHRQCVNGNTGGVLWPYAN